MSKSKGNLVLVSTLRESGVDPMAIRLLLLGHHYRSDWMWDDADLAAAAERLDAWRTRRRARGRRSDRRTSWPSVLAALADDLDAPPPCGCVDDWAAHGSGDRAEERAGERVSALVDAALGVAL